MQILNALGVFLIAYLIGSIPMGLVLVKLATGKDIRKIESGRTGGTNAMRAAGTLVGYGTTILDILKAACTVWIAKGILPDNVWIHVVAPVFAVIGHNYSIYLIERDEDGKLKIGGGAGGTPALGGAVGLWWPNAFIIFPLSMLTFYGIGYASVTTMSVPFIASLIFAYRAIWLGEPWEYIFFGVFAEMLILWALRPNIKRLLNGTERSVGWRKKKNQQSES
ncbi:MAG: glycerol-3-phosphate acyltransferase, partial [Chloroflexota bacterium]|nr:glycerol-3-phosphate acyltransferase [Chloroflexota bacterium]